MSTPRPWNRDWISGALRHICRNVDYDCFMAGDLPEDANIPSYYTVGDVDLIVAAPDLLAECKAIVAKVQEIIASIREHDGPGCDAESWEEAIAPCRAAIAKAESEVKG